MVEIERWMFLDFTYILSRGKITDRLFDKIRWNYSTNIIIAINSTEDNVGRECGSVSNFVVNTKAFIAP
ncbi:MAG: hypothetical protein ACI358_07270 [Candidatus Limimorpha sp.]